VEQSLQICQAVLQFARKHLRNNGFDLGKDREGVLLLKHFAHPDIDEFRKKELKPNFREVRYLKPSSSRSESSEGYFLCRGWRGDG